jgi:tripartite ATP-independent transporter DctM subunit
VIFEEALTQGRDARRGSLAFLAVRADRYLGLAIEIPAVAALLAEIVILLTGVVSRFAFDHPLVWSDELAQIVFLWLAVLGVVVAVRRNGHMRMTAIVSRLPPRWRGQAETLALAGPCVFLALLLQPAIEHAEDQGFVTTPALGWPDSIRASAMPVGIFLVLLVFFLRLLHARRSALLAVGGVLAGAALALMLGADWITGVGNWNLLLFFALGLGACVLAGVPIASSFGLCTVAYLLTTTSTPLEVVVGQIDSGMSSLVLLAVPLFVLLGGLIDISSMAKAMVAFLSNCLGHVRGGLSYVLLGAIFLVSGVSGAKTADMAAVAPVLFPEMRRRGEHEGELVSLLASAGAMAETIPPSLVLIIIGSVTGVSIAALFTGGLLPGLVLAIALGVIARFRTTARMSDAARPSLPRIFSSLVVALPALLLPVLVRVAVIRGIATATEVSTIAIVYAVLCGVLVYRRFDWSRVLPMLVETVALTGAILFILGCASAMSWALTQSNFSHALAQAMIHVPGGRLGFLAVSIVVFIVLGSVLEGLPAMVLFGPLLFPAARAIGVHEVHYAMVIILAMGIGLFAPPFGMGYYAACTIGKVNPDAAMRRIWPYLGALLVGLVLVALIPWISIGFL